jgi:hypothetical protein
MPSMEFEPMISGFTRAKTVHASDRSATVSGSSLHLVHVKATMKFMLHYDLIYKTFMLFVNHHCSWIDFKHINQPIEGKGNTNVKGQTPTLQICERTTVPENSLGQTYPSLDLNMIIPNTNQTAPTRNCSLQNVWRNILRVHIYQENNLQIESVLGTSLDIGDRLSSSHDVQRRSILLEFVSETVPSFSSIDLWRHQVTRVLAHSVYCSDRLHSLAQTFWTCQCSLSYAAINIP